MDTIGHVRIILSLDRTNYPHLISRGQDIYTGIEAYPSIFTNPLPTPATIKSNVDDLIVSQQSVRNRVGGATQLRLVRANALVSTLIASHGYVQGIIDSSPPDQGLMIAKAAGMLVAQQSIRTKALLDASQALPGAPVHLEVNVASITTGVKGKVYFNWQFSSDGGRTWISVPSTPHGRTDIAGLTALTTYAFRVSITSRQGPGPWSEAITFLVH